MRKIKVKRIPTSVPNKFLDISVSYQVGGISLTSYKREPRGYYLHAQPVETDGNWETFTAFSGLKMFIEAANRFSQAKLQELADKATTLDGYAAMLAQVLEKNAIKLEQPEVAA